MEVFIMAMVVRTNIMGINASRNLGMNSNAVGKSLEKLASGFRINRAGDDAAGLAISEKMKAQIKSLETQTSNAQDEIGRIQTGEGALTETHNILNRMTELVEKANSVAVGTEEIDYIKAEMKELSAEITRIDEETMFNGSTVLGDMSATDLGVSGLELATSTARDTAAKAVSSAIVDVSTKRAAFGAEQNRLEYKINNLEVTTENVTAANSRLRDTDMAKEMMQYTKMNVLIQSAQAMLAQANSSTQGVLQLLQ